MITEFELFENNDNNIDDFIWIRHLYTYQYQIIIKTNKYNESNREYLRFEYSEGEYILYNGLGYFTKNNIDYIFSGFNSLKEMNKEFDIVEIFNLLKKEFNNGSSFHFYYKSAYDNLKSNLIDNGINKFLTIKKFKI